MCDTEFSTATERSRSSAAYNFFAEGHVRGWAVRRLQVPREDRPPVGNDVGDVTVNRTWLFLVPLLD